MKLTPDQIAGLYITAIIHLAVIIVLLVCQIGYLYCSRWWKKSS